MDPLDDLPMLGNVDPESREMLGLFDVPAFARRGHELEHVLRRLDERCARARAERLDMVHLRLRQLAGAANGPELLSRCFVERVDDLWRLAGAPEPLWSASPAPPRRLRSIARDLRSSVERFNRRWSSFVDELRLEPINRLIEQYNRYYVLEKECVLKSSRLAARHFVPRELVTTATVLDRFPLLPVPQPRG